MAASMLAWSTPTHAAGVTHLDTCRQWPVVPGTCAAHLPASPAAVTQAAASLVPATRAEDTAASPPAVAAHRPEAGQ